MLGITCSLRLATALHTCRVAATYTSSLLWPCACHRMRLANIGMFGGLRRPGDVSLDKPHRRMAALILNMATHLLWWKGTRGWPQVATTGPSSTGSPRMELAQTPSCHQSAVDDQVNACRIYRMDVQQEQPWTAA